LCNPLFNGWKTTMVILFKKGRGGKRLCLVTISRSSFVFTVTFRITKLKGLWILRVTWPLFIWTPNHLLPNYAKLLYWNTLLSILLKYSTKHSTSTTTTTIALCIFENSQQSSTSSMYILDGMHICMSSRFSHSSSLHLWFVQVPHKPVGILFFPDFLCETPNPKTHFSVLLLLWSNSEASQKWT
jgi:hypothetical protein